MSAQKMIANTRKKLHLWRCVLCRRVRKKDKEENTGDGAFFCSFSQTRQQKKPQQTRLEHYKTAL